MLQLWKNKVVLSSAQRWWDFEDWKAMEMETLSREREREIRGGTGTCWDTDGGEEASLGHKPAISHSGITSHGAHLDELHQFGTCSAFSTFRQWHSGQSDIKDQAQKHIAAWSVCSCKPFDNALSTGILWLSNSIWGINPKQRNLFIYLILCILCYISITLK